MKKIVHIIMVVLVLLILAPIYITLIHSFMGMREIELDIGSILGGGDKMAAIPLLPTYPTLKNYRELLLYAESFCRLYRRLRGRFSLLPPRHLLWRNTASAEKGCCFGSIWL